LPAEVLVMKASFDGAPARYVEQLGVTEVCWNSGSGEMRDSPDENLARLPSVLVTTSLLGVVRLVEGVTEEIVHLSHSWFLSLGENLNPLVGLAMAASRCRDFVGSIVLET
jgi:hypothetical protein